MSTRVLPAFFLQWVCSLLLMSGVVDAAPVDAMAAVVALDRSGDGQVGLAEYQAYQAAVFKARDLDGTMTLVFPEFESTLSGGARANARASFEGFDADRDAALTMGEFAAYQELVFTRFIDRNQDGFMTAEELAALTSAAGSGRSTGPMRLDRNGDGGVDAGEYNAFHSGRFSSVDLDQSGSLSFLEFKKSLDPNAARNARASFDGFDLNKNRRLSDREFLTYHSFVFQRFLDKDKSGSVTAAEWAAIADRNN